LTARPPCRLGRACRATCAAALLVAAQWVAVPAGAQSPEADIADGSGHLVKDSSHYALPEPSDRLLGQFNVTDDKDRFSLKLGLALLAGDYTTFEQDAASRAQVGVQEDEFEARSLRIMGRGHFELWRRWDYQLSYEYKGFDQSSTADWNATDIKFSTAIGPRLGKLTFGKFKEPHVYEMVGDAANLPQPERWLSPFFVSRSVGVQFSNTVLDQRATWAVGYFNDWLMKDVSYSQGGQDVAGRVTALPLWQDDGASYLHLAASVRRYGAVEDELRYRGRPASNVADYYVDTGRIPGDHAWHTGLEALLSIRGASLLAEYVRADLSVDGPGEPVFDGYYLTGSWVLTGEHRPYDRKAGYARRILPQGRWGAVELIGRYGRVDTTDEGIEGGVMDGWWAGVNWWATNRFKASVTYGNIDLDRLAQVGNTQTLLARLQWIY
jgi:phosphate-selective porin OprO and OprP